MADVLLKIKDRGEDKFYSNLRGLPRTTVRGFRAAWFAVGQEWKRELNREILHGQKTGRLYKHKGRTIQASAAGETIANRSGATRRSMSYRTRGYMELDVGFGLGREAPRYVSYPEFGTKFMEERRSVRNAMLAIEGTVQQHFSEALTRAILDTRRGV